MEPTWSETWKTPTGIKRRHPLPGHDVSGEVVEVGPDVTGVAVGEAVYALTEFWRDGAAAEYSVARATDVAPKPRTLGHIQAAGVLLVGLTAWQALFEHAGLTSGQSLLIHGAAGGVGSMAVRMAKWAGATVIATASACNHELLRTLGADEIIDYTTTCFEDVVRDVDMVLDTRGGETVTRSWRVVKKGGLLLSVFSPHPKSRLRGVQAAAGGRYPLGRLAHRATLPRKNSHSDRGSLTGQEPTFAQIPKQSLRLF